MKGGENLKYIKPIYIFILLMLLGAFLTISSYDLGTHAGTKKITTKNSNGSTSLIYQTNTDKISASIDAYKSLGCVVLLIGGIGVISVLPKKN